MDVFVFRNGDKFVKCGNVEFGDEEEFRAVLLRIIKEGRSFPLPTSLEGKRPSIIYLAREFTVASGSIDLLGIDSEGFIYIIETKLYRNYERRMALAQVIDYASALWSEYSKDPDLFIERLKESPDFNLSEEVIENVKGNIRNGGLRLVIAMDYVDETTKNVINFLNKIYNFGVYVLILEKYSSDDGLNIIILEIYPESSPIVTTTSPKKRRWDWESFLDDAKKRGLNEAQLNALKLIYDFSKEITKGRDVRWGSGETYGTFRVFVENLFDGKDIYIVSSGGSLQINFGVLYSGLVGTSENDRRRINAVNRFAEQLYNAGILNELVTFENYKEYGKSYPTIKPEKWMNKIEDFKKAVMELISSIREF
ncbi:MAG: hypothetical protein QXZ10_02210 [Sulfolobales archaeon]